MEEMDERDEQDDIEQEPVKIYDLETGEPIVEGVGELPVEDLPAEVDALTKQLEEQKKAFEEEHNSYLRLLAEFNNYKRRQREEFAKNIEMANQDLLLKLLPVIDNFERAVNAASDTQDFDALAKGVDLTLKHLIDILEKEGVKPIEAVGQEFDPNLHEAMMRMETDEYPDNTIVEEFEKGYTHKDKVLRPSRVKVAVNV
jgi:molecular chaperone GrpE